MQMMNYFLATAVVCGILTGSATAAVIQVPGDFATIQGAIDAAAVKGDEIIVAPGTYPEVINFHGKAIILHSASGNQADTIIDGTGLNDSVVLCINGEGAGTILAGFTITGGHVSGAGGGMFNFQSDPTVINCIFSDNTAIQGAGGIYNNGSNPSFIGCLFIGNSVVAGDGGGMINNFSSSPILTDCTFNGNTATSGGGGMVNKSNSNPTIINCNFNNNVTFKGGGGGISNLLSNPTVRFCTFVENSSPTGGGMFNSSGNPIVNSCTFSGNTAGKGGGLSNFIGDPTVINCTFMGNMATIDGGGVFNKSNGNPTITNCIFSGNTAGNRGGGIYNDIFTNSTLTNCTFSENTASTQGGGLLNIVSDSTIANCIFWGNHPSDVVSLGSTVISISSNISGGLPSGVIDGGGNIDVNPLFINADGPDNIPGTPDDNLRLAAGSQCIDAGDNTVASLVGITTDLEGNSRFVDDEDVMDTGIGSAPIVDMGAYERQVNSCAADILPAGGDGVVDILDLMEVLNTFGPCSAPPVPCPADITPPGGNGAVNIDDLVAILNAFGPCP